MFMHYFIFLWRLSLSVYYNILSPWRIWWKWQRKYIFRLGCCTTLNMEEMQHVAMSWCMKTSISSVKGASWERWKSCWKSAGLPSVIATSTDRSPLIRGRDLLLWLLQLFFSAPVTRRLITNILRRPEMGACSAPRHGERVGVTPCDRGVLGRVNAGAVPVACSDKNSPNLLSVRSQTPSPASCEAAGWVSAGVWSRWPGETSADAGSPTWKLLEPMVDIVLVEIVPSETKTRSRLECTGTEMRPRHFDLGSRPRPQQDFIY